MLVSMFRQSRSQRTAVMAIALASVSGIPLTSPLAPAQAQTVIPDGSLSTTVTQDSAVNLFTVTGGHAQGGNLFHSFDTFSPADYSILFDLSQDSFGNDIERIFSRVTGGAASDINGSLSILGGNRPDLFLLNPNGFIFGANAQLNLAGSFVASTAELVQFADGGIFSAITTPSTAPLLSISTPTGLQFGQNPGAIAVLGNGHHILNTNPLGLVIQDPASPVTGLSVTPGNTLALLGGPVRFNGAELQPLYQPTATGINIPIGPLHLEVGAVAAGSVQLDEQAWGWGFDYSNIQNYQDIELTNRTWLNGGGFIPGRINLSGRNITLDEGSAATVNNWGQAPDGNLSGITIRASELLKLQGNPLVSSMLRSTTTAQGSNPDGKLDAGPLTIWSKNLQILDGAYIANSTFGNGNGGPITISVQEDLNIDGETDPTQPIPSRTGIGTATLALGNADNISITTENLRISNGGAINSASLGAGDGGRVDIAASEQIVVQGFQPLIPLNSAIASVSLREGNSGEGVFLRAKRLAVLDGGAITSSAAGSGDTGVVQLDISDLIQVGGTAPEAPTQVARITATVDFNSAALEILAERDSPQSGEVQNISIRTSRLELFDQGLISVTNGGNGNAGDLTLETNSLLLSDQASIVAQTQTGDGGSLKLMANESILMRQDSEISASSQQEGSGGNIIIKTPLLIAPPQENSDITANATSDFGGDIAIDAASVIGLSERSELTNRSDITASSERGAQFSGSIELSQPDAHLASGITVLPSSFAEQDVTPIARACSSSSAQLTRSGRGGLPLGPNNLLHDTLFVAGENDPINQAIALRNQGFYSKALALLLNEAASPATNTKLERQAIVFRQLGITYKLLEQHKESRAALEQSLAMAQRLNNPEQTSATLLSLGNLTRAKSKIEQARNYYQQALTQQPSPTLKHQILANQFALETAEGQQDVAQRLANALLGELAGSISDQQQLETRLNVAATTLRHQSSEITPNFLAFLQQNWEGAKVAGKPEAIAYALGHLGQAYEQGQQWDKAETFSAAALQLAQSQKDTFQEYQWAWQLGRITRASWENSGDASWYIQSQTAYKMALQALQQLRGDLATVSPALQFSFRNRVEPVYRQYVSLLLASETPYQANPSSSNLKQALQTIEALHLAELDNFFKDACLETTPQSIESLDPNAAVIYPILLDDHMAVIVSYGGKLQHHKIPISPQELEATARRFQQRVVTRSRRNYKQQGQQLYDWLIRPMLSDLEAAEIETLVFVPDGPLANIPMAALFDGEQFLMEQFNIAIAPSLQLLPSQSSQTLKPQALVAGISKANQGLGALTYVEQEVDSIKSHLPTQSLLNEAFTHASLERALLETQTPIVHIATHGQFSSKASDTFIAAWDEQINIEQLHQLLSSRDRNQLNPTELLILSACETAIRDDAAALGLAGVAVRAGARSTLASLWSINDQSTAQLMEAFYQQLSQPGSTKSEALRAAQLAMLDHPIYQHPYYWSAFVLMGSWQ